LSFPAWWSSRRGGGHPSINRFASCASERPSRILLPRKASESCVPEVRLTLPSNGRSQAGFACLCPPLMSNVRALKVQSRLWHAKRQSAHTRIAAPQPSCAMMSRRRRTVSSGQVRVEPVSPSSIREKFAAASALRHAHYASDRQQDQSVVGALRRRAAPGNQSVDLEALSGSGPLTSSSKRVGRVCCQECA
jgi:hypothetical protein